MRNAPLTLKTKDMTTFKIIGRETGFFAGMVKGADLEDCENLCLAKGLDMYDEYMLIDDDAKVHPASTYIEDVLN